MVYVTYWFHIVTEAVKIDVFKTMAIYPGFILTTTSVQIISSLLTLILSFHTKYLYYNQLLILVLEVIWFLKNYFLPKFSQNTYYWFKKESKPTSMPVFRPNWVPEFLFSLQETYFCLLAVKAFKYVSKPKKSFSCHDFNSFFKCFWYYFNLKKLHHKRRNYFFFT